jgi:hypothetical protein
MMISDRPPLQAPRLRPEVEHPEVGGFVDPQRRALEVVTNPQHLRPLLLAHLTLAQLVARDPRPLGDQPLGELGVGHLEREEGHGAALAHRDMLGDVGDQARLAHPRPRGEDDQVPRLKAAGDRVEVGEARRRAGDLGAPARQLLEPVDLAREDVLEHVKVLDLLFVGDVEEQPLGPLGQLHRLALVLVDGLLDRVRGAQQAAQERVLLDDPGVVAGVARHRDGGRELGDAVAPARLLELALLGEQLRHGERVDWLAALVEPLDRPEDHPVALAVEVLVGEADVEDHRVHRRLGDHQRAEHRFLGLEVLGRYVCLCGRHRL